MWKILYEKIKEATISVVPIAAIGLIISLIVGLESTLIINFVVGVVLLILGLALFSLGAENSMIEIAEKIGGFLVRKRKIILYAGVIFILGFLVMFAEPALYVLTEQFQGVNPTLLIILVSVGMGLFVMIAFLRIIFQVPYRILVWIGYGIVFSLAIVVTIVNPNFVVVGFDSGAIATGPLVVPFVMALGLGVTKAIGNKDSDLDSFGLVGIISLGPILMVLILGLFTNASEGGATIVPSGTIPLFTHYLLANMADMALAILPFIVFFIIFQLTVFKLDKHQVIKVFVAFLYVYIGLVLFLTGANAGLVQLANQLGNFIASSSYAWVLIPIGMLFGSVVVAAEPSVMALNQQVEEVTAGAINKRMMLTSLAIGVGFAVGLSALRVLTGISIWWVIGPVYGTILLLLLFTPKMYYVIAFDSGGAVSGVLTTTFLMPFILGAGVGTTGANILTDAFGLVAVVAMTPILVMQVIGLLVSRKQRVVALAPTNGDEVIEFESEDN